MHRVILQEAIQHDGAIQATSHLCAWANLMCENIWMQQKPYETIVHVAAA